MRDHYWDRWKGVAIIAVVLIHTLGVSLTFPDGSFNKEFGVVLRQFINFPVGLFVFIAALFAVNSSADSLSYWPGVKKRVWRLAKPYLIWSLFYFSIRSLQGYIVYADFPLMLLNGTSVAVGYYVIVMIQMSLVSPFLERMSSKWLWNAFVISILTSIGFTYSARLEFSDSIWGSFPYNALPLIVWLPFYIFGILAAKSGDTLWQQFKIKKLVGIYAILLVASIIEATLVLNSANGISTSQVKISSLLTTITICLIVLRCRKISLQNRQNWLSWIGQRSYYFYLSHMLVLMFITGKLKHASFLYDIQPLFMFVTASSTLVLCSFGAMLFDSLTKKDAISRRGLGLI